MVNGEQTLDRILHGEIVAYESNGSIQIRSHYRWRIEEPQRTKKTKKKEKEEEGKAKKNEWWPDKSFASEIAIN